jgi:hypothetical protein
MSAGMILVLYRVLASGVIHVSSRGYRPVSRDYSFADSPVLFIVFFALQAALAGFIIFVTVFLARRVTRGNRPG